MRKIVFATNNQHKLKEINEILKDKMVVLSLADINFYEDIPETGNTLEANASQKSHAIFDAYRVDCFSDDTGLEVDALDGRPGVYSARYAGEGCSFHDNVAKLLQELKGHENRRARFRTVVSLILDSKEYFFEGVVEGEITREEMGVGGFGYDPVFYVPALAKTAAELSKEEKNAVSHRGQALKALLAKLGE